jgi:hypothetical protein
MKVKRIWMIIICLMALSAFQCGGKGTVPEDLIGVWETTSPSYADRPFEITAGEVIFGIGEGKFDAYPIAKIKTEKDPAQKTLYIIYYKNMGGKEYKFSFYYDPANRGKIQFKNQQEMVWTKRTSSPAS